MLAEALSPRYHVQIIGFVFEKFGSLVWEPVRDSKIPIISCQGTDYPDFNDTLRSIAPTVNTDVILVSKPRLPSMQLGLLMKAQKNRPIILDIDDYELSLFKGGVRSNLFNLKKPYGCAWSSYAESLIHYADQLFVSNMVLQNKYGGTVIPHARNEKVFDPTLYSKEKRRIELSIPLEDKIILFLGTPRRHKGLIELMRALKVPGNESFKLCIMGAFPDQDLEDEIKAAGDKQLLLFPSQPFHELANNLAVADFVCVLQDPESEISKYQLPAKAIDAAAMGIPVLAYRTPPLEALIDKGLVIPTTANSLAENLKKVLTNSELLQQEQQARRNIFLEEYSYGAILEKMEHVINKSLLKPKPLPDSALSFINITDELFLQHNKVVQERGLLEWIFSNIQGILSRRYIRISRNIGDVIGNIQAKGEKKQNSPRILEEIVKWVVEKMPRGKESFKKLIGQKRTDVLAKRALPGKKKVDRRLEKLKLRLFNLGFTDLPLSELHEMMNDRDQYLSRLAIWELARWYANQGDRAGAEKALQYLAMIKQPLKDPIGLRKLCIMEVECHERLGNIEKAEAIMDKALRSLKPHPDLFLTAANLENSPAKRVKLINKALAVHGLSPISHDLSADKPSLDCLRPDQNAGTRASSIKNGPKVTVIIPVYNAEDTIKTALDSVLAQTWSNLEIFIVDDCSSDDTLNIIEACMEKDSRIQVLKNEKNSGPYVARNIALKKATGDFVTTHDSDDWSHPEKIEKQVKHLMQNPSSIGNMSQMARTTEDLKFYRGNNPGNIILEFVSSFLFRRSEAVKAIGYWNNVRFAADNEYIRRLVKKFGEKSVVYLKTGPLTFYRQSSTTLTGSSAFGHPGFYMGARKEYYEAQTYYHNSEENLYYEDSWSKLPFPVPEPMCPDREVKASEYRHFDVILVSDFRMAGGSTNSNAEEIKAQIKMGLRTGLIQMSRYDLDPGTKVLPQIRELIDGNQVQMLVYGEKLSCDLLLVRYPPVVQEMQRYVPEVKTDDIRIIVNQPPMSDYGKDGIRRYDIRDCHRNIVNVFGRPGIWHPNSPLVREALYEHHSDELSGISLSDDDWVNIIDIKAWRRSSRPVSNKRVIIGRHSRDNKVKWPADKDELLAIYPDNSNYEVHVLGGAETPKNIIGRMPKNWIVKEFDAITPLDFLKKLDIFIYYTHPDWVESFARVIIEAMAVGVPVILPPIYRELFSEAAVYAEPFGVRKEIDKLMKDDDYYQSQVEKAFCYLEENFSYEKHAARVGKIIGRNWIW